MLESSLTSIPEADQAEARSILATIGLKYYYMRTSSRLVDMKQLRSIKGKDIIRIVCFNTPLKSNGLLNLTSLHRIHNFD